MSEVPRTGVIHDLGYRPYDGPRAGSGSDRARTVPQRVPQRLRARPVGQVEGAAVPAAGPQPAARRDHRRRDDSVRRQRAAARLTARYASATQILLSIFVAAQAPVLFSRDLRHGSIALYLARPLSSAAYAVARWAALLAATLVFLLVPIIALYVGAVLAELDFSGADRGGGQGGAARGAAGADAHRDRRADRVGLGAPRLRGGRDHRRAAARQRRRHRDPGHLRGAVGARTSARWRGCSRRTPSTAAAISALTDELFLTPPAGTAQTAAYFAVMILVARRRAGRHRDPLPTDRGAVRHG